MSHFFLYVNITVDAERFSIQGSDDVNNGTRSRGTVVRIRRSRILEDGKIAIDRVGAAIKDRIVVKYVNEFGEEEAGAIALHTNCILVVLKIEFASRYISHECCTY